MIVALARKLLVALWRLVTTGEVPEGVVLRPAAWGPVEAGPRRRFRDPPRRSSGGPPMTIRGGGEAPEGVSPPPPRGSPGGPPMTIRGGGDPSVPMASRPR